MYLACYVIFVGIHLYGVGEALRLTMAITALAVVGLIVFVIAMVPKFDADNLFDIVPNTAAGASDFIPFGYAGVLGALVYGIWFFLAVEGVPLAAEEARDPRKDMPRGIITAMGILLVFAALMLVFTAGGAYSRQLFALSRAGYLPRFLSVTGKRKTPYLALVVPGAIGFLLAAITQDGALLINIAVFGATVSYVLMMLAHIVLRVREPNLDRPYRTPGGVVTTSVALVLAITAVVATFFVDQKAAAITAGIFVVAIAYFWFYSRHHLVASAPEEEFAAIQQAESELG